MDIAFEKGERERPRGHALLYFRSSADHEDVWATYLVVLPVKVDVSKYLPPFLMSHVGDLGTKGLSAFAFPPAPERLPSYGDLERIASSREDDVLYGGTLDPTDIPTTMMMVTEAIQLYADWCSRTAAAGASEGGETPHEEAPGLEVNDVLYSLMGDRDKLSELTRLVGRLRYAVEGSEPRLMREAEEDIMVLARHLPENHLIPDLITAVRGSFAEGPKLAELYVKRCYHLILGEYAKLGQVEKEIRTIQGGDPA